MNYSLSMPWRRGRDSNPRWGLTHTRFPGVRLKPLIHLSVESRIVAAVGLGAVAGARCWSMRKACDAGLEGLVSYGY